MNNMNTFAIIGTGAVGALYGTFLERSGRAVHYLLRSDFAHVRAHGLRIDSPWGDFSLPNVNAYSDPLDMPRCDVVIVALKTTANSALADMLPHVVKDEGIVLTLQNGLGSEEDIAQLVGAERVMGGLCFLCSNKIGPGHIHHLDYGLITIGEYRADHSAAGITPRLQQLGDRFEAAGIPIQLVEDLVAARWRKLVWNIPFNGLSVARGQLTNTLVREPETRAICEQLMHEVAEASAAHGRVIEDAFIEKMLSDTERMEPYAPSMKLDFDRGNPMELQAIYGAPIKAAEAHGVDMPNTRALLNELEQLAAGS